LNGFQARGLLLGCTRPVALQTLVSTYELQEKLLTNLIQEMVKNASLPGSVSGGSSSLGRFWILSRFYDLIVFVRNVHSLCLHACSKALYILDFFTKQVNFNIELQRKSSKIGVSFIYVATLGQVGLPRSSLAEIFPSAIPLQKLFINPVLLSMV
jgi:hypothetical protein